MRDRVVAWYLAKSSQERLHLRMMLLAVALYAIHYMVWCWPQPFFIEDSAISFSYARNVMQGEGLVPYVGGERIEGYSNPLWTLLIGVAWKLGAEVWWSSKIFGFIFGVVTLFLSYGIGKRVRPEALDAGPLIPPFLLAASTQFVLWNASGLENSLFNILLSGGIYLTLRESETASLFPGSALCWLGLCLTRPEGMAYAGVGFLGRLCVTLWRGGLRRETGAWRHWVALLIWCATLILPFAAYQLWRYDYFAWLWPNTYYAKEKNFKPFNWGGGGWPKLREYMITYGIVFASPAFLVALLGDSRWRRYLGIGLLALLTLFIAWDGKLGLPEAVRSHLVWMGSHWVEGRVWLILLSGVILGLTTMGSKGWEARTMLWACYCTGIFFQIFSGGDWMKGYRWFSLTSVPQFTLLGVGLYHFVGLLPAAERRIKGIVPVQIAYTVFFTCVLGALNVPQSYDFALDAETAVRDVHQRVRYMSDVQRKLGLDRVTLLDVDMGAHMWYTNWHILDIAGLIDIPVARHDWQKPFSEDYIMSEYRPDFAHVHGAWARSTRLTDLQSFKEDYLEIPGFPAGGRSLHVGNHIRKDLVVSLSYTGPERERVIFGQAQDPLEVPSEDPRAAPLAGQVILEGWEVPAPIVAPGGMLYVSTTWRAATKNFRMHIFFSNAKGEVRAVEVAPAWDWYMPEKWKPGEYVHGAWPVAVPEDLPEGAWDIGFVLIDQQSGLVIPAANAVSDPRFMLGEYRLPGSIQVVSVDAAHVEAKRVLDQAIQSAQAGNCEASEVGWRNARRHVARDQDWADRQEPRWTEAMVGCLVARAEALSDLEEKAVPLMYAWRLDHRSPVLLPVATVVGEQLEALGDTRAAAEDWEGAFRAFSAAVKVDARRSWARRKAEECRDYRLKIKMKEFIGEKPLFTNSNL